MPLVESTRIRLGTVLRMLFYLTRL